MRRWVVFTDLDGTLLDHESYSWAAAAPALEALEAARIPVVIVTSKTAREVRALRRALGNVHPFVVENGAATVIPADYFGPGEERTETRGATRERILAVLAKLRGEGGYRFAGFSDLGIEGIRAHTGLGEAAAEAANDRAASEPLLWQDSEPRREAFLRDLADEGLRAVQGGRFLHVMGENDKAGAMGALLDHYRKAWQVPDVHAVALGDGPNDLAMLAAADVAVVVRGRHRHPMPLPGSRRVIRTSRAGPEGWQEAMGELLPELTAGCGERPVGATG